jgi:hypothetical protein
VIDDSPFTDVRRSRGGFSIPDLKWRELLFIGALRLEDGAYVRDVSREFPKFEDPDIFRSGIRYRLVRRARGRAYLSEEPN